MEQKENVAHQGWVGFGYRTEKVYGALESEM